METGDWRCHHQAESRQRIVNMIMQSLEKHLPLTEQEGLVELKKIAVKFEEMIYTAATSESDYVRKITLKMLSVEKKSQNPMPNAMQSSSASNYQNPPVPASQNMQSQLNGQGAPHSIAVPTDQSQAGQQLLSQNLHNNIASTGVQGSASLVSALPSVSSVSQNTTPDVVGQSSNLQNMPNISGSSQNPLGDAIGQGIPSNTYANSQRPMQGTQQQGVPQQHQQQSQNSQQYLYQKHLQNQLTEQMFRQGNIPHSQMQSHIQQQQQQEQQQQNLLKSNQLHSSQQSVIQSSTMQSSALSGLQQSQNQQSSAQQPTQSVLQQHRQSALSQRQQQQAPAIHQQQVHLQQQPVLPTQQQQQLVGQHSNSTNIQQTQMIGHQNNIPDMQQLQQRLVGQHKNHLNQQQQLMDLQNFPNMHQQLLGSQNNIAGLHQQQHHQLLGTQSGISIMPTGQQSVNMLQQSNVPLQQEAQQSATLLANQGQQSQPQSEQQMMALIQSQQGQLQQQPNPVQRDMQQRLQIPGDLLQQKNLIDQHKQLCQSQRAIPKASSTSLDSIAQTGNADGGDWQEDIYQKIKAMKDMYLSELIELYRKIVGKLYQHESLPQQPKDQHLEKFKACKIMVERCISLLKISKGNILPGYKDKLGSYEKQIINILSANRHRKPVSSLQQGQALPPPHMHSMQQSQQPHSQMTQLQPLENQMSPQMQSMNLQGSGGTLQQKNMASLQHSPSSPLSGHSNAQQNMMTSLQPSSSLNPGHNNTMRSLQQVGVGSLQHNPVSGPQKANINLLSSQSGMNSLQTNLNPLQSNALQYQHLKQQEQLLQKQHLKQQFQHRQMQQQQLQLMHKQLMHQPAQLQPNQVAQLHQVTDGNDLKMRQQIGVKLGAFQQHLSVGQRAAYQNQQLKAGTQFPISSPQLLQPASPQISQHPSPQIDQQNIFNALNKASTPLQSENSPFVAPSPSSPFAPLFIPGESDKINSAASSLSSAGNIGHQQATGALLSAQSLAIGTPGISALPLLAEITSPDGQHGNAATVVSGKSCITEQPLERLLKVVKSMSTEALTASVGDIGSVVSMIDRIPGSAPGNGSRASVGEDLVAITKFRLQVDGSETRKMKRNVTLMTSDVASAGSINDSFKNLTSFETSELESSATSPVKKPRIEADHALLEEIREINLHLVDTLIDISDEDMDPTATSAAKEGGEGTIIKCSFSAVALSQDLKSHYVSSQMSPIQPLRLLIPTSYPNCCPILLDGFPVEESEEEHEDLSVKAKCRFSISLRSLSQPISIGEMAKTWDICARSVISEYVQQSGGGTFSSKFGTWESCLSAA